MIVRTDHWLAAHPDAPPALRRIIIEQRSHLHRALTAQACTGAAHRVLRNGPLAAQNGSYGALAGGTKAR